MSGAFAIIATSGFGGIAAAQRPKWSGIPAGIQSSLCSRSTFLREKLREIIEALGGRA